MRVIRYSVPFAVADGHHSTYLTVARYPRLSDGHPLPRTVLNNIRNMLAFARSAKLQQQLKPVKENRNAWFFKKQSVASQIPINNRKVSRCDHCLHHSKNQWQRCFRYDN
jgi:hypothetical protein